MQTLLYHKKNLYSLKSLMAALSHTYGLKQKILNWHFCFKQYGVVLSERKSTSHWLIESVLHIVCKAGWWQELLENMSSFVFFIPFHHAAEVLISPVCPPSFLFASRPHAHASILWLLSVVLNDLLYWTDK